MADLETLFTNAFAYDAAFESAWRWFRRNKAPSVSLSEIVARVQAKCPNADPARIKSEVERRMSRTRQRRAKP